MTWRDLYNSIPDSEKDTPVQIWSAFDDDGLLVNEDYLDENVKLTVGPFPDVLQRLRLKSLQFGDNEKKFTIEDLVHGVVLMYGGIGNLEFYNDNDEEVDHDDPCLLHNQIRLPV